MKVIKDRRIPSGERGRIRDALRDLSRAASIEVTPLQIHRGAPLRRMLPVGSRVYVPFLPGADFYDSVAACRQIIAEGMHPVPHLAARAVRSVSELDDWLSALTETGGDSLLLIAGDCRSVAGPFASTLALLETGRLLAHGIRRIGVAGHPDGNPVATRPELDAALAFKLEYARATGTELWIVTQFVFSSGPVISWLRHLRASTSDVQVHIGVPGPARLTTLIAYAAQCGVTETARMLRKRPNAARLLTHWTPDGLVKDLAAHAVREPHAALNSIHVYPFGGLTASAAWLDALARSRRDYHEPTSDASDRSRGGTCNPSRRRPRWRA